jgi:hypothetical protein
MAASLKNIDQVEDLLDRLRLDLAARARGAIVVEGPTDADVLSTSAGVEECLFFPVGGRINVLRIADRLADAYMSGVVCVADTDFDEAAETREEQWFVVFTDNADLEAMCYWSSALDRVVGMWCSPTKLGEFGGMPRLRDAVGNVVRPISDLRHESAARSVPVMFDAVNLHDVVAKDGPTLNLNRLVSRLARASTLSETVVRELLTDDAPVCTYTGRLLARGRDCLAVVDVALRKAIGSLSAQQVKGGLARKSLLLAVRDSDLADLPFTARLRHALTMALGSV